MCDTVYADASARLKAGLLKPESSEANLWLDVPFPKVAILFDFQCADFGFE